MSFTNILSGPKVAMTSRNFFHRFAGTNTEDISCIVWCHLRHDYMVYTFFDPFPNGTPCGPDKYCINGHCLPITEEPGRYYYYETEPISQPTIATLPPPIINTFDDSDEDSDEHTPSFPKALPTISTKRLKILHPSQKRMEWNPPPELKEQEFDSSMR